ncbi:MAG: diguanylate cyclase/phosphodiesterase with sensor [Gemmatimonadetes bacterium]|nr:diguanylate cyclase/phosphodiesterase with sensor [Gemmatimonadota bacterium]
MPRILFILVTATALLLSYALLFVWRRRGDGLRDLVTGLANRDFFERYLQYSAARAARLGDRYGFAVVIFHLDGLDALRASVGRLAVDEIVADFAERVFWCVRPSDVMARVDLDAFGLVLDDCREVADAARVAMRVRASLTEAVTLSGREVPLSVAIGITMSQVDTVREAPELIAHAEMALDTSRESGRTYAVYGDELDVAAREWLALEKVIVDGRVGDHVELRFAPAVDPRSFALVGFSTAFAWASKSVTGLDVSKVERVLTHSHAGPHLIQAAIGEACAFLASDMVFPGAKPFVEVRMGALAGRPDPIVSAVKEQLAAHGISGDGLRLAVPVELVAYRGQGFSRALAQLAELGVAVHVEIDPSSAAALHRLAEVQPAGIRVDILATRTTDQATREAHARLVRSCLAIAPQVIIFGIEDALDFEWVKSLPTGVIAQGTFVSDALDISSAANLELKGRLTTMAGYRVSDFDHVPEDPPPRKDTDS